MVHVRGGLRGCVAMHATAFTLFDIDIDIASLAIESALITGHWPL
jgi:hypothetical protein